MKVRKRVRTNRDGTTTVTFVADFRINGVRQVQTIKGAKSLRDAERAARELVTDLERKAERGRHRGPVPTYLEAALELDRQRAGVSPYTVRMEKGIAQNLCRVFGSHFRVDTMTGGDVEAYKRSRTQERYRGRPVATRTINMELQLLKALVHRLVEAGSLPEAPCQIRKLPAAPRMRRYLSRREMLALLSECRKEVGLYETIAFMANTGLRRGECYGIMWKDIDLESGMLTVRTKKRGRSDHFHLDSVPLNPVCLEILRSRMENRPVEAEGLVFGVRPEEREDRGKHREKKGCMDGSIPYFGDWKLNQKLKAAAKRAGIEWWQQVRVHDLRHAFANLALEGGGDIRDVSAMLRHRSIATTLNNYLHPRMETMKGMVETLSLTVPEPVERAG